MPDYKEDTEKFVPWEDEEGRKRKPSRGDSIPPKTNIQSRVHSKPKTDGQEYLDMYIRAKEKERTEKYGKILSKRLRGIADSWRDIKKYLSRKEKGLSEVPKDGVEELQGETNTEAKQKKRIPANMNKMDWNY